MTKSFTATLLAVAVLLGSSPARAQFPRRGATSDQPSWWVGLSYGFIQPGTVYDGPNSGTIWDFKYTSVTSAELAKTISGGTVGVLMNFATAPLTYSPIANNPFGQGCLSQCSANADITQILLELRLGSRGIGSALGGLTGLHGVYGLDVGATQYANFRDSTATALPPKNPGWDPTFGFHFGLGLRFSRDFDSYAVEEVARVIHSQGAQGPSSPPSIYTTRFGIRVGF